MSKGLIMEEQYSNYGNIKIGFGKNPAIIVVDFQRAFTDQKFPMGGAPLIERAVKNTQQLLVAARMKSIPVIKCIMGYNSIHEMPHWKVSACHKLILGRPECAFDKRIHEPSYDITIVKSGPSIFFQTPIITFLTTNQIDTIIVTGCVTSGCVRASIIDSFQYGFKTVIVEDCVGDHEERAHKENLRDVERRYADVTTSRQIIKKLQN